MGNNDPNLGLSFAHNNQGILLPCLQRCELQIETALFTSAKYPAKQVFSSRKDYCYVLRKVARICSDNHRRKSFEASQEDASPVNCDYILWMNGTQELCSSSFVPNQTSILSHKNLTKFLLQYAQENLVIMKIFIKDPFYTK
jgi:hypothetical protein